MTSLKNYKVDLKNKYERYFKISIVISLLLVIAAFKFSPKATKIEKIKPSEQDIILVEDVIQTKQESKLPDLPKPVIPTIAVEENTEDIIFDDVSIDYKEHLSKPPDVKEGRKIIEDDTIFIAVEKMPEIIGGIQSIQNRLYYPEISKRAGIEGRVTVEAVIDEKGNVISITVLKSVFSQLDEIALNAVKETKFLPGKQRGKPVKVKIAIPIDFKLK